MRARVSPSFKLALAVRIPQQPQRSRCEASNMNFCQLDCDLLRTLSWCPRDTGQAEGSADVYSVDAPLFMAETNDEWRTDIQSGFSKMMISGTDEADRPEDASSDAQVYRGCLGQTTPRTTKDSLRIVMDLRNPVPSSKGLHLQTLLFRAKGYFRDLLDLARPL